MSLRQNNKKTSIEWVCEYRNCDKTFLRYKYQVTKNTGKYCCQSHASQEQHTRDKQEKGPRPPRPSIEKKPCTFCTTQIDIRAKYCKPCRDIFYKCKTYGLTPQQYNELIDRQDNKCAICRVEECQTGKSLSIDHDHESGRVRGLLCYKCNTTLGWFEKRLEFIINYLAPVLE